MTENSDGTRTRAIPERTGLIPSVVIFMSAAAAVGTSTIYVLQPSITPVSRSLGSSVADIGAVLACGPLGYLVGLVALVPLVDRYPPGRVLGIQFAGLSVALGISAVTHHIVLLAVIVAITGACSVIGAGMSSTAGRLSMPGRRATTLGVVTAGISAGILSGRILGGLLADHLGWRGMLLVFASACAVLAVCCPVVLPRRPVAPPGGYLTRIRSIPTLFGRHRVLRIAALRGALWFFGFCSLWAGLAVALSQPPFSYSSERIGLYALAGLSGIAATRSAGVWTDRIGHRKVILTGLILAAVASLICATTLNTAPATFVTLACFDAGLFAAQVANQSTVLAIDPSAPARFNSAYMVVYFVGGSLGTAFGAAAVGWFGWTTTVLMIAAAVLLAAVMTLFDRARPAAAE